MPEPLKRTTPIVVKADPKVLGLKEAAEFLGISKTQMLNLLHGKFRGPRLKHTRIGRRILIRRAWIDQWLEESARFEDFHHR